MKEIYPKIKVLKDDEYEKEVQIMLCDQPYRSESVQDFFDMMYDYKPDELVLDRMNHLEYERDATDRVFCPSGKMEDAGIIYATGLKYCLPNSDANENPEEEQAEGKRIQWLIYLEGDKEDIECAFEYYIFYRDEKGDVCRLHDDVLPLPFKIRQTGSEGSYIVI